MEGLIVRVAEANAHQVLQDHAVIAELKHAALLAVGVGVMNPL